MVGAGWIIKSILTGTSKLELEFPTIPIAPLSLADVTPQNLNLPEIQQPTWSKLTPIPEITLEKLSVLKIFRFI